MGASTILVAIRGSISSLVTEIEFAPADAGCGVSLRDGCCGLLCGDCDAREARACCLGGAGLAGKALGSLGVRGSTISRADGAWGVELRGKDGGRERERERERECVCVCESSRFDEGDQTHYYYW